MQESDQGEENEPEPHRGSTPSGLLPTAKQEIQFSFDQGLMAWSEAFNGRVIQLVMPDESTAWAMIELISNQHGEINEMTARQSSTQGGRWVVQIPTVLADHKGILPKGLAFAEIVTKLPRGKVPNDPIAIYRSRQVARAETTARGPRQPDHGRN